MQIQQTRQQIVDIALSLVGYPSVKYSSPYLGKNPPGFDCSGLIVHIINKIEIFLPPNIRHCNEFLDSFGVFVHEEHKLPGDLIFFSRKGSHPTHIGVVVDSNHYVHAPGLDGTVVEIAEISNSIIPPSKDQIYQKNPIGYKRVSIKSGRWQKLLT
jgi:cell wall-associated NlpC family hydrolase